jgi:TonB-linked SusC/RagA family outer membrane protein
MKYKNIKIAMCFSIVTMGITASSGSYLFAQPNNISFSTSQHTDSLFTDSTELIQVAFRKVKRKDLMGEVNAVNLENLLNRNYTTYSLDNLESFISGYNGNIWGTGGYLLLVDGFPRDANNVMPTEIEQISVMKGINAVALYGSRAAKGVIYITTKRGKDDDQKINIRSNAGIHTPISYPKYLGSAEYMTLYNEARRNDGLTNLYSDETIFHHSAGVNPYRYPNLDYYSSDYIKESYNRYDATAEVSGGGDKTKYYTNFGFWSAGSLLNFGEARENNTSNRFNMRGNIDAKLNNILSLSVNASASFYTQKGVNTDYWGAAATGRPHRFAPLIPISFLEEGDENSWVYVNTSNFLINGQYLLGGSQLDQSNAFATIYAGGNSRHLNRQFQFDTGLDFDLSGITEGLTFQTALAIDYQNQYNQSYNNSYAVFQAAWNNYNGEDLISSLTKYGEDRESGVQNIGGSTYRQTIGMNARLNYFRTFNDKHNVSAILLANAFQIGRSAEYHKQSNANLGLHIGYNFDNKYYADFSSALPHSAKLPEGRRKAFSPTLSLAWRLSEEEFMKGGVFNDLRLKASAGLVNTDLDIEQYYLYQGYYTYRNAAWYSWRDGELVHSLDRIRGNNDEMRYPQRREFSLGLEASMFNNLISYNATYFYNQTNGLLVQASTIYPMYFMSYWPVYSDLPFVNFNNDERRGVDFGLNINKSFNKGSLSFGVTGLYYDTKAARRDEVYEFAYQNRTGKPLDAIWGLQSNGFYQDQADIDNSVTSAFGEVKPGDIKYIDQNGDGTIDTRDEIYLGKGGWAGAPFTLGFNFTAKYKNLTLFAVATSRSGAYAMRNSSYFWVDGEDKYSEIVRDRWTPEASSTATYPRLTTTNSDNNFRSSDFWMYKTNRFDLSKVQISYDFPKAILGKGIIRELGTYVNGFNLLTIAPEKEIMQLSVGSAPQTRMFNFGVKAVF